ncbi:hypothetical protein K2173_012587 [Erythroxylum novogranatense]|uniref:Autophagy-related protein 13 N-terminal domain-containing protein n=1 Tax=Erythroxylum novogranatense TaxID=1862640 RepID=A0AAV8S7W1_9ROSI|nr:hypothetical protein K2173_012587 [Erythroxylum novogranatense]
MDSYGNYQHGSGKLEHIISQFLLKSLHIILDSRIPSLQPQGQKSDNSYSVSRVRKSDKWFNLVLGDRPAALDNLHFWHRNLMDPMIIDIILVHQGPPSSSVDNSCPTSAGRTTVETVLERWVVQYESARIMSPQTADSSSSYKKTYKKSILLLRSLYAQMRLLPAYRIFRQLNASSQTYDFDMIYKVSSFCEPFSRAEEEMMKEYSFTPVESAAGRLSISVTYCLTVADFNLEPLSALPPKIITDYVGSPTTDPLRSFPSSEKGVRATSFPLRGIRPNISAPLQRPHSWTSGFHRAAPSMLNQTLAGSPPAYRATPMSHDFSPPPFDTHGNKVHNYRPPTYQRGNFYDECHLSPPFSPSLSPSTTTCFANGNSLQSCKYSETAPVTIPLPITGKNSRYNYPNFSDPSKHSLPPLSPRSARHDASLQESPSRIRSIKKLEILRAGELNCGLTNQSPSHKVFKDSKDDSGRFSGLLSSSGSPRIGFSRSSSRLSFQDDIEDCDFSCPFDVDDVDAFDGHISDKQGGRMTTTESTSRPSPVGNKSQDAAVGILVHMLRTARPLRQDPTYHSSHCLRSELEEGVATASGFFMPRKTTDALEELRSYKEMKDLLLSKSGTRVIGKEEA